MAMGATKPLRLNTVGVMLTVVLLIAVVAVRLSSRHDTLQRNLIKPLHDNATTASTAPQSDNVLPAQTQPAELRLYNNPTYGFSYSYPATWLPGPEVSTEVNKSSATQQEFGTSLKTKSDAKNSATIELELLNESAKSAENWYDAYYGQTLLKVQKNTTIVSGRQSVEYNFVSPTYTSKQYLIPVGEKTYVLSSVNESTE